MEKTLVKKLAQRTNCSVKLQLETATVGFHEVVCGGQKDGGSIETGGGRRKWWRWGEEEEVEEEEERTEKGLGGGEGEGGEGEGKEEKGNRAMRQAVASGPSYLK